MRLAMLILVLSAIPSLSAEPDACALARELYKAANCSQPFAICDSNNDPVDTCQRPKGHPPDQGWSCFASSSMMTSQADAMRAGAEAIRAQARVSEARCRATPLITGSIPLPRPRP